MTRSRTPLSRAFATTLTTVAATLAFSGFAGAGAAAADTVSTNATAGPAAQPSVDVPVVDPSAPTDTTSVVKGDNGDVKVHDSTTPADDQRDEPHVCTFYLVGFNFDASQDVAWKIRAWPPTGHGEEVLAGTLTLGTDGHGRTEDLTLPDGHYKLFWNFDGENGRAKHKVFWVKCEGQPSPGPSVAPTPSAAPPETSPSTPPLAPAPPPTPVTGDLPVVG